MADQDVRVELKSSADTSGFEKFESSYNTLRAAKQAHIGVNAGFVDSERRVRTNLVDLVGGLATARDGLEATSSVVAHLSEVFKIGFAGTVIAGIGAAIIEQFAKADEAIKKTTENILKGIENLKALHAEITGQKIPPELKDEQALRKEQADFAQNGRDIGAGFFGKASIGLENIFGIGSGATNYRQAQADQALRSQVLQSDTTALAVKKVNDAFAKTADSIDQFTWSKQKPKTGELGTRDFENALQAEQGDDKAAAKAAEAAHERDRATEEAARQDKEAAREAGRKSDSDAKEAAREQAEEDQSEAHGPNIRAHILAGSQRQHGGGGGAYSVITNDPVLSENRKQTGIQADIANILKQHFASPAPAAAATFG